MFKTTTTFLPQARMASRKARSLSVNGRSEEVMKRTRSARGTNSRVSSSCSRSTALVPGVSTITRSRRISAGAVRLSRPAEVTSRVTASPWRRRPMRAVVGVTPSSRAFIPRRALMKALFPALNSPTTTRRNGSSSCSRESARAWRCSSGGAEAHEPVAQLAEESALVGQEGAACFVERGDHGIAALSLLRGG